MDVAQHSEAVEAELTRFIEKRHDLRGKTEGEQLEEELWKESERRYLALRSSNAGGWRPGSPTSAGWPIATGPYRRTTSAGPRSSARKERWHRDLCLKVKEHAA